MATQSAAQEDSSTGDLLELIEKEFTTILVSVRGNERRGPTVWRTCTANKKCAAHVSNTHIVGGHPPFIGADLGSGKTEFVVLNMKCPYQIER